MDEETLELIAALCLRAGALMEDRSVELVESLSDDLALIERRIVLIEQAGQDLAAFALAARALVRSAIHEP